MSKTFLDGSEICCSKCWANASCTVFAYSPTKKQCWIKTKVSDNRDSSAEDRISRVLSM